MIGYDNIPLLCIGNLLNGYGLIPTNFVGPEIVIGRMTYSEKKTKVKGVEAIFSSLENVALKVSAGIGSGALGLILTFIGFDGKLDVQSARAVSGIAFLYNWIPIFCYGALFLRTFFLFDLDKKFMAEYAIRGEMDCIVTRNLDDYKKTALPVYSPEEFLLKMKQ